MEALLQAIKKVCRPPPQMPSQMARVMTTLIEMMASLNKEGDKLLQTGDVAGVQTFVTVVDGVVPLILNCTLRNMKDYCQIKPMTEDQPWNGCMAIFQVIALLLVVTEDPRMLLAEAGDPKMHKWKRTVPATDLPYARRKRLVATTKPMDRYAASDITDALWLTAAHAYTLESGPEFEEFVLALMHRASMISAQPGGAVVHDVAKYRSETGIPNIFRANSNYNRAVGGSLLRFLFLARFSTRLLKSCPPPPRPPLRSLIDIAKDHIPKVRAFIVANARELLKTSTAKGEIVQHLPQMLVTQGDLEAFVHMRGMEMSRFQSVLMQVKTPMQQQAWARTGEFIMLDRVVEVMVEEEPGYFDQWTFAQHCYALLTKTYVVDMAFTEHSIDFFDNYVVWENHVATQYQAISNLAYPVIVHVLGRLSVVYQGQHWPCVCTEHAIALWFKIVEVYLRNHLEERMIRNVMDVVINGKSPNEGASHSRAAAAAGIKPDKLTHGTVNSSF